MSKGLIRYRLLLAVLAPAILIFNAWQALRAKQFRLFHQRLGLGLPHRNDAPLWIHAASVGELIATQPLIEGLRKRYPKLPIVVTTVTPTGAQLAQQRLPAAVKHYYLPMDWPGASARFLRAIKPRTALIMETELWPNLFNNIQCHNIPLIIVNGRLSSRTRNASDWVKSLYDLSLNKVSAVLARSKDDAEAYIALGAPGEKVQTIGNIKFAHNASTSTSTQAINLGRPYVLAASTHDNEEQQLADLWLSAMKKTQETRTPQSEHTTSQVNKAKHILVIAPRHPKRKDNILRQLHAVNVAVRSHGDTVTDDTQIYLADTLGELEAFMQGAECVFMGGSLIPHGGQNILEPARLGKPIVFGPHMSNFTEETQLLLDAGGAKQVPNANALGELLAHWLTHPEQAVSIGQQAAQLMSEQEEVLDHYLNAISEHGKLKN
ncbi:MAG: 3-deoxy-D-manno-octulosonic acid transferase [Ectothiorhodospiraceae bacterium]|nr:3-deoxy-D-manno-octulosonic acid transferase [Ectothiorhodospiraceae bacterium]